MQPISPMLTTPVWKIDPQQPEPLWITHAAALILKGGVIIYPTETFYGLGGHPGMKAAIERIFRIKERDFNKPLPLIAAHMEAVREAVGSLPPAAEKLAAAFWPGPLTLVLPLASRLPSMLHAATGKIAVRISPHPVARDLAAAVGGLLIATSANAAGRPACRDPEEIPAPLIRQVDGLLDAGSLPGGAPSTIVDVSVEPPRLVRDGVLPWEEIRELMAHGS